MFWTASQCLYIYFVRLEGVNNGVSLLASFCVDTTRSSGMGLLWISVFAFEKNAF